MYSTEHMRGVEADNVVASTERGSQGRARSRSQPRTGKRTSTSPSRSRSRVRSNRSPDRHQHGVASPKPMAGSDARRDQRHRHSRQRRRSTRSLSPGREEEHRRHRHSHPRPRRDSARPEKERRALPFGARQLSNRDLASFRPLFAHYLDLQKRLDIALLDETELRGRWKSFVGKWNRGELAEGWYDPAIFELYAAQDSTAPSSGSASAPDGSRHPPRGPSNDTSTTKDNSNNNNGAAKEDTDTDTEDDGYGPRPPPGPNGLSPHPLRHHSPSTNPLPPGLQPGPTIPSLSDLAQRDEEAHLLRTQSAAELRAARRAHRASHKALLDELAPKPDAGTHERRVEKRRAVADKLRGFAVDKEGGMVDDLGEGEVMGGFEADAKEEYRRLLMIREEKKKERVGRREEMERIRRAEREERVRSYREREERVLSGLREIARQRFG